MANFGVDLRNAQSAARTGFVLLHGAGLGSWIWDRVIPKLHEPSLALNLPTASADSRPGIQDCVAAILQEMKKAGFDRVVLVGHSVSSMLALKIATDFPRQVSSIVLVAGGVPESGKAYVDTLPRMQRMMTRALYKFRPRGSKPPKGVIRKSLCNDLRQADCDRVIREMIPENPSLFLDRVRWTQPPCGIYVKLLNDRALAPRQQEMMAHRLKNVRIERISSGHLPMLSHPDELAAILNRVVDPIRNE